ncbi:MAG: hypothetical protein AAGB46_19380 [Verrucomicrobiota bacterium]
MKKATCLEKLQKTKVDPASLKKFLAGSKTMYSKAFWVNSPKKKPETGEN